MYQSVEIKNHSELLHKLEFDCVLVGGTTGDWALLTLEERKQIIGLDLTKYLKNYAAIGEKYVIILDDIIEKNSLIDFDKAEMLPTKLKTGVAL